MPTLTEPERQLFERMIENGELGAQDQKRLLDLAFQAEAKVTKLVGALRWMHEQHSCCPPDDDIAELLKP